MPFNLLLLPALGGYWLLRNWHRTRYRLARQDGYRFVLWVALVALALLALATLLVGGVFLWVPAADKVSARWRGFVPFAHAGKAVLACVLGLTLPVALNRVPRWQDESEWAREAMKRSGDDLELLIVRSLEARMPLMVTLASGKVYVGYVVTALKPDVSRRYLRVLPLVSGYQDDTQRVVFTTGYEEVRHQAADHESPMYGLLDRDFEVVLPLVEVRTLGLFDFVAYEAFKGVEAGEGA